MGLVNLFKGGVSVPHRKNTENCETIVMPVPDRVIIPMLQHIGAPCEPKVKKGDYVKVGEIIGDSSAFISAPIHSSVSGTVKDVSPRLYANGELILSVEIKPDKKQEVHEDIKPPSINTFEDFKKAVRSSGLVGLGGAGFPTHVKFALPEGKTVDTLVINGAECEPYITADYRECIENPQAIIDGIDIVAKWLKVEKVLVGIEDNKPEAIKTLSELSSGKKRISVLPLRSKYPQGAEKMLIYALTGRKVPPGKLPLDVGCVVLNINTVSFISKYVKTGMPLIKKKVTVDGSVISNPSNLEVLIGTPLSEVFNFCGGFKKEPHKVLMGGPMMGVAQHSLETSVIKVTNALIVFDKEEGDLPPEYPCIRCGRCVDVCPMNLLPLGINRLVMYKKYDELEKYNTMDCIECGSCSYVCPSKRHLVQSIRLGKKALRKTKSS